MKTSKIELVELHRSIDWLSFLARRARRALQRGQPAFAFLCTRAVLCELRRLRKLSNAPSAKGHLSK